MTMPTATVRRQRRRDLVAAMACIAVFSLAFGLSLPLLSLLMDHRGTDIRLIGLITGFGPVGTVLIAPLIPVVAARYRFGRMAMCSVLITAIALVGFKLTSNLWVWFALRIAMSMAGGGLFALSEALIVRAAQGPASGRIIALYAVVMSGGFAAGPMLLTITGIEGWTPFIVGAAISLAALAPLFFSDGETGEDESDATPDQPASFLSFAWQAPVLLAAVAVFGLLDAATISLLPIYALRKGTGVETASLALGVLMAGNIVLQYPIGWVADIIPRHGVMLGCALITVIACLAVPVTIGAWLIWPVLAIVGAAAGAVYTLAMAIMGDRFDDSALIAGSSAFAAMFSVGNMVGPVVAGWAMHQFGPDGLPFSLCAFFCALAVLISARNRFSRHMRSKGP